MFSRLDSLFGWLAKYPISRRSATFAEKHLQRSGRTSYTHLHNSNGAHTHTIIDQQEDSGFIENYSFHIFFLISSIWLSCLIWHFFNKKLLMIFFVYFLGGRHLAWLSLPFVVSIPIFTLSSFSRKTLHFHYSLYTDQFTFPPTTSSQQQQEKNMSVVVSYSTQEEIIIAHHGKKYAIVLAFKRSSTWLMSGGVSHGSGVYFLCTYLSGTLFGWILDFRIHIPAFTWSSFNVFLQLFSSQTLHFEHLDFDGF